MMITRYLTIAAVVPLIAVPARAADDAAKIAWEAIGPGPSCADFIKAYQTNPEPADKIFTELAMMSMRAPHYEVAKKQLMPTIKKYVIDNCRAGPDYPAEYFINGIAKVMLR